MGSVSILTTTGDNDPEIIAVSYYRHYLYCDACGSFELEPWIRPSHWQSLEKTRSRLAKAALLTVPATAVGAWFTSAFLSPWLVLFAGLTVAVGLLAVRGVLGSGIEFVGRRCRLCLATYGNGSPFFTDLSANPWSFTVADVPRPLGSSPYVRGATVEEDETSEAEPTGQRSPRPSS